MQRVLQAQYIPQRISSGQRYRHGADDAGVNQGNGKQRAGQAAIIFGQTAGYRPGILEIAEFRMAHEHLGGKGNHRHRTNHHQRNAQPQIGPLIGDEAWGDALVDDVALLEEQLPGGHRGADNADDQQHHVGQFATGRHLRDQKVMGHLGHGRMHHHQDGKQQQAAGHQNQRKALEAAEVAGTGRQHDEYRSQAHANDFGYTQKIHPQADADEFGDDGQRIEQEQVDGAEGAPEFAKAFQNQPRMANTGDCAQTQHHFLVHIKHGNQQRQCPQQAGAVVLSGLGIGAEGTGVVVPHHHDEAGAENGQQGLEFGHPAMAGIGVVVTDGAQRTADVSDVGAIQYGGAVILFGHVLLPETVTA